MSRRISKDGLEKIKEWEGFRAVAYEDISGKLTIGYGHTSAAGGPVVKQGQVVTQETAEKLLKEDIRNAEIVVDGAVKVPLTDSQFAALVSFQFNTGGLVGSHLLKKLNKGHYDAVPGELARWIFSTNPKTGKKEKSQGLINRRALEAGLWAQGASVVAPNTVDVTPAQPPVSLKETVTWGAGVAASAGAVMDGNGPIQWVLAGVVAVCFAIGVYLFIKNRLVPH